MAEGIAPQAGAAAGTAGGTAPAGVAPSGGGDRGGTPRDTTSRGAAPAVAPGSAVGSDPGGRWRLWEQFSLRGPGFPVDGVKELAPAELALHAEKFDH
ncbi:hypothetical protein HCN56_24630, partial [Streptomyces lonarensis]|nr:hypothetical protein [Streptomyces lonarensis]